MSSEVFVAVHSSAATAVGVLEVGTAVAGGACERLRGQVAEEIGELGWMEGEVAVKRETQDVAYVAEMAAVEGR